MHYSTIIAISVPTLEEDVDENKRIEESIKNAAAKCQEKGAPCIAQFTLHRLRGLATTFSRAVEQIVMETLAPFSESTENPEFLEFEDHTAEAERDYKTGACHAIRYPNGTIVGTWEHEFYTKYSLTKGMVMQRSAGQLHHDKRTKKAKKIVYLPKCPNRKVYSSFEDFATCHHGYDYNREENAYGYFYNPKAFYDWYAIGGRWPLMFLVSESCKEYSIGDRYGDDEDYIAPAGYRWVVAARKKDIAWDVMRKNSLASAEKLYEELKNSFHTKQLSRGIYWKMTPDGIYCENSLVYAPEDTLDAFIARTTINQNNYSSLLKVYAFLSDEEFVTGSDTDDFARDLNAYIDSLDDDAVLVGVDCHL